MPPRPHLCVVRAGVLTGRVRVWLQPQPREWPAVRSAWGAQRRLVEVERRLVEAERSLLRIDSSLRKELLVWMGEQLIASAAATARTRLEKGTAAESPLWRRPPIRECEGQR